ETGAQGPTGNDGLDGIDGATGATGSQGEIGLQGPTGETGLPGVTGPTGEAGAQGPTGNDGSDGQDGDQGIQGPAGNDGGDDQTLSISGDTLSIEDGNSIVLPIASAAQGLAVDDYICNDTLDVEFDPNDSGWSTTPLFSSFWQEVIPQTTAYLSSIELKFNGAFSGGTLNIYDGAGISGTLLTTVSVSSLGSGWQNINIPGGLAITANNSFTFELFDGLVRTSRSGYPGSSSEHPSDVYFRTYFFCDNTIPQYIIEPATEYGTVNLSNIDTINFSNGHVFTGSSLMDSDLDTKIEVEQQPDEDIVRISIEGTETYLMDRGHLQFLNTNDNVYIGENAGASDIIPLNLVLNPEGNVAIGTNALSSNAYAGSTYHTAVGYDALKSFNPSSEQDGNVALGSNAYKDLQTGQGNTAVGRNASMFQVSGNYNTVLGYSAGANVSGGFTVLNNTTAIGAHTQVTQDSTVILGNAADVGIGTSAPDAKLHVVGDVKIVDGTQGAGKVLTSDAAGLASWQAADTGSDDQTLSISGDTLSIEDGNSIIIPTTASIFEL
ncbi:MAG: hypothetical protein GY751_25440, partial [Bacteroidetes bacterium]|nr:hypothetical protein [Bacteroidota bacterium]